LHNFYFNFDEILVKGFYELRFYLIYNFWSIFIKD